MEYLYLGILVFKLIWCLEINGKYILLSIADHPSTLKNDEIGSFKGNNITSSRTIKKQGKLSQRSALNPKSEVRQSTCTTKPCTNWGKYYVLMINNKLIFQFLALATLRNIFPY